MAFKALKIDDKEEESEDENFDIISKKFMKYIKLEKIKGGRFHRKKDKMIFSKENEVLKKKIKMNDSYIFLKNFPMNKRFST